MKTKDNKVFKGNYLIIATPPNCVKNMQFYPELSRLRKLISSKYIMGSYTKMVLLY
mgnify:FL=1